MLSFLVSMGLLAIDLAISLHRAYYDFASPFISCYPMGLQADSLAVPTHFFINLLLRASLAHFSRLYLFWALLANIPTVPTHFTTSFLGLSQPVYFLLTSFTFMGFLLDYLDFPCPITISLPFITFWAYWTLSRPIEFTNSFLELPHPSYFFFTSFFFFFPIGLLLHPLGFSSPFTYSLSLFLFLWACWPSILPFQPNGLISLFLHYFLLLTFSIVGVLLH